MVRSMSRRKIIVWYEYDEKGKDAVLVDGNTVGYFRKVVIGEE